MAETPPPFPGEEQSGPPPFPDEGLQSSSPPAFPDESSSPPPFPGDASPEPEQFKLVSNPALRFLANTTGLGAALPAIEDALAGGIKGLSSIGGLATGAAAKVSEVASGEDSSASNFLRERQANLSAAASEQVKPSTPLVGGLIQGASQFLAGGALAKAARVPAATKAVAGKIGLGATGSSIAAGAATGAVADFTAFDPSEGNLSNALRDTIGINLPTAIDMDDSQLEGRLKNVAEGGFIGGVADSILQGVRHLKKSKSGAIAAKREAAIREILDTAEGPERLPAPDPPPNADDEFRPSVFRRRVSSLVERMSDRVPLFDPSEAGEAARGGLNEAGRGIRMAQGRVSLSLDGAIEKSRRLAKDKSALESPSFKKTKSGVQLGYTNWKREVTGGKSRPVQRRKAIDGIRSAVFDHSRAAQENGLMRAKSVIDPETGEKVQKLFPVSDGRTPQGGAVLPYKFTQEFYRIASDPNHRYRDGLKEALMEADPRNTEEAVDTMLNKALREVSDELQGNPGDMHTNIEFGRELFNVPDVLTFPGGRSIPIQETNPVSYLKRYSRGVTARIGFSRVFGQGFDEATDPAALLSGSLNPEARKAFSDAIRTMHGLPIGRDVMGITDRTLSAYDPMRFVPEAYEVARSIVGQSLLGASAANNAFETGAGPWAFSGTSRWLRGTTEVFKGMPADAAGHPWSMRAAMEHTGQINRDHFDRIWAPDKTASENMINLVRNYGNVITLQKPLNEFTEQQVASIAREMVGEMASNTAPKSRFGKDVALLRTLDFSEKEARRIARGRGTIEQYHRLLTEMPSRIAPGNILSSEKGVLENNPLTRGLFPFQTWAANNVRRTVDQAQIAAKDTLRVARNKGARKSDWSMLRGSMSNILRHQLQVTAAGVAGTMAVSYLKGGPAGLQAESSEFRADPIKYAARAWFNTLTLGPLGPILMASEQDASSSEIARFFLPVKIAFDFVDAARGVGSYSDLPIHERILKYADQWEPFSEMYGNASSAFKASIFGMADQREWHQIEQANLKAYIWMRKNGLVPKISKPARSDPRLWKANRRVYEAMSNGADPEKLLPLVRSALEIGEGSGRDIDSVIDSLRARKKLVGKLNPETAENEVMRATRQKWVDDLKANIGPDNFERLKVHDAAIDALTDYLYNANLESL